MEELKKVLMIGAHIGTMAGDVIVDGKVDIKDLPTIYKLLSEVRKFTEVDYKKALDQLKGLTLEQRAELAAEFSKDFDLPKDEMEKKIEQIVDCSIGLINDIFKLIDVCSGMKRIS